MLTPNLAIQGGRAGKPAKPFCSLHPHAHYGYEPHARKNAMCQSPGPRTSLSHYVHLKISLPKLNRLRIWESESSFPKGVQIRAYSYVICHAHGSFAREKKHEQSASRWSYRPICEGKGKYHVLV